MVLSLHLDLSSHLHLYLLPFSIPAPAPYLYLYRSLVFLLELLFCSAQVGAIGDFVMGDELG